MIVATHQPIFLPWPGFFAKAIRSDCMVLLDDVQFPRGRTWLCHNRLKDEDGEVWLTVPVWRKNRGLQVVRAVEIYEHRSWRRKHLQGIRQNYACAPYFDEYFGEVEAIYGRGQRLLSELNTDLIRFLWDALSIDAELLVQSDLGIEGEGTDLLVDVCRHLGASRLAAFPMVEKHIDVAALRASGIDLHPVPFRPPVYPQLWGAFIHNLSTLDLLLNCGPKARDLL